jgi:hypothetical protein
MNDALATAQASTSVGNEKLHHRAYMHIEVAVNELFVGDTKSLHCIGWDVAATSLPVFNNVLIEVRELQSSADIIGEKHEFL